MYGLSVYIEPKDILEKLSDEDKEKFNACVFTDIRREQDGSVTIDCVVFDSSDPNRKVGMHRRQNYFKINPLEVD